MLFLTIVSCKKKFENPAPAAPVANAGTMTIARIRAIHFNHYNVGAPTKFYRFNHDSTIECTVIADEASGNLYKTVYVKDATAAIKINLRNGGGIATGDKIRVNLRNVLLNNYGGVIQLDSVMLEEKINKISSGNPVEPIKLTYNQLITSQASTYESQLVQLDSVQFELGSKNQPFADAVNRETLERTIVSLTNTTPLIVRTSGYSNFATNLTPCGSGKMMVIMGQYNGTKQLTLRQYGDINFAPGACPYLTKNFEDKSLTSGGWRTINAVGNTQWGVSTFGNYAACSNYANFTNNLAETWLLSPSINLSNSTNPILNFISVYNYSGPAMQVLVSTNYTDGNPNAATWGTLTPTLPTAAQWSPWVNSGNLNLSAYKQPNVTIAFKYTGTSNNGSTWQVDNIVVVEN